MSLVTGINHVAILTQDLDRFTEFYTSVFDLTVVFAESTPAFRHAIVRAGVSSWLHPVELPNNVYGSASPQMFTRGHIDHVSLLVPSAESFGIVRERLLRRAASAGVVEDLGAMHALWFQDPDGMRGEVCFIVDADLRNFHAPVPIPAS